MISSCVEVDTGVAVCGRLVVVPSEEISLMIALARQWRLKVFSGWCVNRKYSFQ